MPKEQRNRGPKVKAIKPVAKPLDAPAFLYFSVCCNLRATKPALLKSGDAEGTLGSWRCTACGKSCKCNRTKNSPEIKTEVSA
jgi:hypothetical protein